MLRRLVVCSVALSCGCLQPRMVHLQALPARLPPASPSAGWKADIDAIIASYEESPVLAPADPRLEPIFGGLTTLTYYGTDLGQKLLDQQTTPGHQASGVSVATACEARTGNELSAPPPEAGDEVTRSLANPPRPTFTPVWVPLRVAGGAPAPEARCEADGSVEAPDASEHFCLFARVALQPVPGRPLTIVVHGMFDSSAQDYVQRIAAVLYREGHSVLLPDMRDHGHTFRRFPGVPASLGSLEGLDLLRLADALRSACGTRITSVGAVGVSGGGLDVIRAASADDRRTLDGGAIAISPLLDVQGTLDNLDVGDRCGVAEAVEITWPDYLTLMAGGAVAAGVGGVAAQSLSGDTPDESSAWAAVIGAAAGLTTAIVADALIDGDAALTDDCIARASAGSLFTDMLRERWRTLGGYSSPPVLSAAASGIAPERVTLEDYLRLRSEAFYTRVGRPLRRHDPRSLAHDLRGRPAHAPRLLVLGAQDDPITRSGPVHELGRLVSDLDHVHVRVVQRGGHGAMWVVQQSLMVRLLSRFFSHAPSGKPAPPP